jgi:NADPH:quinone reductase-like Zn-dependent oxidoreductase
VRALLYDRYGGIDALRLEDVADPVAGAAEAIVDVRAAALNPKDALVRRGKFRLVSGRKFPKLTGVDFAGTVRAAGARAGVAPGDRVFGFIDELRYARGTLAERVRVRADEVARLPDAVSFEEGAALALAGLTALQALRDLARLGAGDAVAIHGASGGVGTVAIQVARVLGARVITTSSARNVPLCRELGADEALDYAQEPLGRFTAELACIFDVFGNLRFEEVRGALRADGVYVTTVPRPAALVRELLARVHGRRRLVLVRPRRADLELLGAWAAEKRVRAVIDRVLPLAEHAEAFRVLESKRARGKLVLTVAPHGAR